MSGPPAAGLRTLTIDRGAKAHAVRELMRQCLASGPGRRRLALIAVLALFSIPLFSSWVLGVGFGLVLAAAQVGWWRIRVGKALRKGYQVGQTISVGYLESEEFTVVDEVEQVMLPRGSVMQVVRRGGVATVLGRSISLVLPSELLTDADVAFLEGHGRAPEEPRSPAPRLPLALEVTPDIQDALVAAKTRVIVTSADFLLVPLVTTPVFMFFASYMHSWRFFAGVLVFCLASWTPQLRFLLRSRQGMRVLFPVGYTMRAEVSPEQLSLAYPHGTVLLPWSAFQAHRITPGAVLLRADRGKPGRTRVLPRALFAEASLAQVSTYLPRRF